MCHNSLSEPCPHLVRWLMGISIIGFPITTLLTSLRRISPLLTPHPEIPPGPNRSVWNKCQTQFGSGVNTRKHGRHTECHSSSFHIAEVPSLPPPPPLVYRCFPAVVFRLGCLLWHGDKHLWTKEKLRAFIDAWRQDGVLAATKVRRIHKWETSVCKYNKKWAV